MNRFHQDWTAPSNNLYKNGAVIKDRNLICNNLAYIYRQAWISEDIRGAVQTEWNDFHKEKFIIRWGSSKMAVLISYYDERLEMFGNLTNSSVRSYRTISWLYLSVYLCAIRNNSATSSHEVNEGFRRIKDLRWRSFRLKLILTLWVCVATVSDCFRLCSGTEKISCFEMFCSRLMSAAS